MTKLAMSAAAVVASMGALMPQRQTVLASQEVMDYLERIKAKDPMERTTDERQVLEYALAHDFEAYPSDLLMNELRESEPYDLFVNKQMEQLAGTMGLSFEEVMRQTPWWQRPAKTTIHLGRRRSYEVQNPPGSNARPHNVQQRKSRKANRRKRG